MTDKNTNYTLPLNVDRYRTSRTQDGGLALDAAAFLNVVEDGLNSGMESVDADTKATLWEIFTENFGDENSSKACAIMMRLGILTQQHYPGELLMLDPPIVSSERRGTPGAWSARPYIWNRQRESLQAAFPRRTRR